MQMDQRRTDSKKVDPRSRGSTEPDPDAEQRTGSDNRNIGKSVQQEDRK